LTGLGALLLSLQRLDEAEELLDEALAMKRATLGEESSGLITTLVHLGEVETARGRYGRAERRLEEGLDMARRTVGERGSRPARIWRAFARLHLAAGDPIAAASAYRAELAAWRGDDGPDGRWLEPAMALARLQRVSDPAEARRLFAEAAEVAARDLPPGDPLHAEIDAERQALALDGSGSNQAD
jgi:tetratricopeptide (TPR) repeat protein